MSNKLCDKKSTRKNAFLQEVVILAVKVLRGVTAKHPTNNFANKRHKNKRWTTYNRRTNFIFQVWLNHTKGFKITSQCRKLLNDTLQSGHRHLERHFVSSRFPLFLLQVIKRIQNEVELEDGVMCRSVTRPVTYSRPILVLARISQTPWRFRQGRKSPSGSRVKVPVGEQGPQSQKLKKKLHYGSNFLALL